MMSSLFDRWWSNFIQWCIIIVPLLLSLWLTGFFLEAGGSCATGAGAPSAPTEVKNTFDNTEICQATTQILALGALIMGIMMSMSLSSGASQMIIKESRKRYEQGVKATGKWAEKQAYLRAPGLVSPERRQKLAESRVGQLGKTLAEIPGVKRLVAPAIRRGVSVREEALGEWKKIKDYDKFSSTALRQALNFERDAEKRTKILDTLATKHPDELNKHVENLSSEEKEKFVKEIKARERMLPGGAKNVFAVRPDIAQEAGEDIIKFIRKITSKDIQNWSPEVFKNKDIVREAVEQGKFNKEVIRGMQNNPAKILALNSGLQTAFGPTANMNETLKKTHNLSFEVAIKYNPNVAALFNSVGNKSTREQLGEMEEDLLDKLKKEEKDK